MLSFQVVVLVFCSWIFGRIHFYLFHFLVSAIGSVSYDHDLSLVLRIHVLDLLWDASRFWYGWCPHIALVCPKDFRNHQSRLEQLMEWKRRYCCTSPNDWRKIEYRKKESCLSPSITTCTNLGSYLLLILP